MLIATDEFDSEPETEMWEDSEEAEAPPDEFTWFITTDTIPSGYFDSLWSCKHLLDCPMLCLHDYYCSLLPFFVYLAKHARLREISHSAYLSRCTRLSRY